MSVDATRLSPRRPIWLRAVSTTFRSSFFWTLVAVAVVGIAGRLWLVTKGDPAAAVRELGVAAPLVTLALQTATTMTPVGSSVIPTINGMLFPIAVAMALNVAGGLTGNIVMYYVWRRGEREIGIQKRLDALPARARRFARTDLLSLVALRMLPWAGGNLATLMAGVGQVPLRVHILGVLLGSVPGAVIYALLGAGIIAL